MAFKLAAAALLAATLTACGGGGGGSAAPPFFLPGAAAPSPAPQDPPKPAPICTVDLYGDSIMYGGYALTLRLSTPPAAALRALRPAYTVVDRSANGDTITMRSMTFNNEARSGRIVVIEQGINDTGQGWPIEALLTGMVEYVKAEGRTPVLTGLTRQFTPVKGRDEYDATIRRVADATGAAFADWGSVPLNEGELADGLHPGQEYSARLVQRLAETLDEVAPECAP